MKTQPQDAETGAMFERYKDKWQLLAVGFTRKFVEDLSNSLEDTMPGQLAEGTRQEVVVEMLLFGVMEEADRLGLDFDDVLNRHRDDIKKLTPRPAV